LERGRYAGKDGGSKSAETSGLSDRRLREAGEVLIDGRNRLAACELAGVEPVVERLNGEDPAAFIVSANSYSRLFRLLGAFCRRQFSADYTITL
jgi:hypothetical protein